MAQLKSHFRHLNLTSRTVQRLVKEYKDQITDENAAGTVRMVRRRATLCGGQDIKLTVELAKKLINNKNGESSHVRN